MDFATAEGSGPFQDHPSDPLLELINPATQAEIDCKVLRHTTALLKTAMEDIDRAVKFRTELGDNNDMNMDKALLMKIEEFINKKTGLEEQVRSYGPCAISNCMFHHKSKKKKANVNEFVKPAKRHASNLNYYSNEEKNGTSTSPKNSNNFD
ncbi:hypothetical protein CDAR_441221 [Caerostris darwini]|uniref:Uncharacterized protein n=1 Tax=Caerostris darwini TaxID=1538125 RepID=A0AAV4PDK3_9ARAC|nr:hypothetical protein CDAR_441221 [Caerostris darwini]